MHSLDGQEKGLLLAPFDSGSALVRYCRYPSPACGESTLNPPRSRPTTDLTRIEVRRGSRTGRGALIGAAFGALGGLVVLYGRGFGDAPATNSSEQVGTVVALAATWALVGGLIGAMSDKWEEVP
jgi:hypothetical protein